MGLVEEGRGDHCGAGVEVGMTGGWCGVGLAWMVQCRVVVGWSGLGGYKCVVEVGGM